MMLFFCSVFALRMKNGITETYFLGLEYYSVSDHESEMNILLTSFSLLLSSKDSKIMQLNVEMLGI